MQQRHRRVWIPFLEDLKDPLGLLRARHRPNHNRLAGNSVESFAPECSKGLESTRLLRSRTPRKSDGERIPQKRRYTLTLGKDDETADSGPQQPAYDPANATVVSGSDIGRVRNLNQDDCGEFHNAENGSCLLVVADGMGGHRGGEVASQMAVQQIRDVFERGAPSEPESLLVQALREANDCIFERANNEAELAGMGTTAVALLLDGDSEAVLAHVGDSRAYRMRHGQLKQLTADHSVVGELVRRGQLSAEEARHHPQSNEILRALGTRQDVDIEITRVDVQPGDCFLMCSDGLSGMLSDKTIEETVSNHPPEEIPPRLIELANEAGGMDNITVQVATLPGDGLDPETTVTALEQTDPGAAATGPWLRWAIALILIAGVLTLLLLGGESPQPSP